MKYLIFVFSVFFLFGCSNEEEDSYLKIKNRIEASDNIGAIPSGDIDDLIVQINSHLANRDFDGKHNTELQTILEQLQVEKIKLQVAKLSNEFDNISNSSDSYEQKMQSLDDFVKKAHKYSILHEDNEYANDFDELVNEAENKKNKSLTNY